ncbi:MAG: hypothetical protein ABI769_20555 [Pseudomonadota bacterium]
MKYLAVCLLSIACLWNSAGASQSPMSSFVAASHESAPLADRALAGVVAFALVGMQLRRRQKSLRMPRSLKY